MKNKKRIFTIIFIIITISMIILLKNIWNNQEKREMVDTNNIYWVTTDKSGKKTNNSKKMEEIKEFEGLTLKKQEFVSKDSKTEISIKVINNTPRDIQTIPIVLTLLNQEGEELVKLKGIISPTKAGESTTIYINSSLDYINVYDFKVERNTEFQ